MSNERKAGAYADALFRPLRVGAICLEHRVVLAPMTRVRAMLPGNLPTPMMAEYYGQRSSRGGLLVTEATQVTPDGRGYPASPGIYSPEQIEGWKQVVRAVKDKGGYVFLQLWHAGRVSHSSLQPGGGAPVAPSPLAPRGSIVDASYALVPFETPRALSSGEVGTIVDRFQAGAIGAMEAGFDGVEIHAGNGYLIEQFLNPRTNRRNDAYGGTEEGRSRLLLEIVDAVSTVTGPDRVGVRLSPLGVANDIHWDQIDPLLDAVLRLDSRNLAYLHIIEPRASGAGAARKTRDLGSVSDRFRSRWRGVLIAAGGFDGEGAAAAIDGNKIDAVAFGRAFLANPDLPSRLFRGVRLNDYDRATFYSRGPKGYIDYPPYAPPEH